MPYLSGGTFEAEVSKGALLSLKITQSSSGKLVFEYSLFVVLSSDRLFLRDASNLSLHESSTDS